MDSFHERTENGETTRVVSLFFSQESPPNSFKDVVKFQLQQK